MFKVVIYDQGSRLYNAQASRVSLPAEEGECQVMAFHAPMISVLRAGQVVVDGKALPIRKGIAKMDRNELVVVVEQ